MRLADFAELISHMPVSSQAFASKRSTWSAHINREDVAGTALRSIFSASDEVFLSRSDLRQFASKTDLAEFAIATIIWGYPRGMRGNHFANMVGHIDPLCKLLSAVRSRPISDWNSHYETLRPINGIGLSTYTKLLHFLSVKVGRHEALILDQRIIDAAQENKFEELAPICGLNSFNAARRYPEYLECMNRIALRLSVPPERIEFFLFEFGLHLKPERDRLVEEAGAHAGNKSAPLKHGLHFEEDSKSMDDRAADNKQDDNPYTQEEYERDLAHSDLVSAYQKRLSEQLGHPVTFGEAEDVAYGLFGTIESRTEELRQRYALAQSRGGSKADCT